MNWYIELCFRQYRKDHARHFVKDSITSVSILFYENTINFPQAMKQRKKP